MDAITQKLRAGLAKVKVVGIGFLLFMMTIVDSISQLLSTLMDGFLAVCVLVLLWWTRPVKKKEE